MPITGVDPIALPALIETERLRLRALQDSDLERLVALIGDWEVARWLARVPYPYTWEDGRSFIREMAQSMREGTDIHYAIALRDGDALIGGCGFMAEDNGRELGYWLGRPCWGRGYMPEALRVFLDIGFRHMQEEVLFARVLTDNLRSRRLLEGLGFRNLGMRPGYFPLRKETLMVPHYELARADWPQTTED